jgi:O-antigen/teichoic acid export membrane protein
LVLYVFGPDYRDALAPMFILLPGMIFLGTGMVIAGDLQGRGRPGVSSLLALMAAVVTVGLDIALIPPLGVIGAAAASLIAYVLFGLGSVAALSRLEGLPLRRLLVPGRSDFRAYPTALRGFRARVGLGRPTAPGGGL